MKRIFAHICFLPLVIFCGCERKEHTPPPAERVALTVSFFKNAEEKNSDLAVYFGSAIYNMNKNRSHIRSLISIQESNEAVAQAQRMLDQNKVKEAVKVIAAARKNYPANDVLKNTEKKLAQLISAEQYLSEMNNADTAAAITEARETIESGLSLNFTAGLRAYLAEFREKEAALSQKEQLNTQAVLEEASAAAEKAKAEDAAREAENIRFMEEMAEMSSPGEQMRKEAGDVPFDTSRGTNGQND